MTEEHAKNYLYRICGCRPDYLFAEKVVEIIKNLGSTIEEKEKQIEKMKCCNNCKYKNFNWSFQPICTVRKNDDRYIENPITCKCEKWELAE